MRGQPCAEPRKGLVAVRLMSFGSSQGRLFLHFFCQNEEGKSTIGRSIMQTAFYGLQFFYDEKVDFPPGEVLLREGETQTRIYVLRRGSVEVVKGGEGVEKRGELFGEISALLGIECTTTVRTREQSTLLMIEDAEEFLENHPRTTMFIAKMLAARLTDATNIQALLQREHRELKMESERPKPM